MTKSGAVTGVKGSILVPSDAKRGEASSREVVGEFEFHAQAVLVSSGGIGGNFDLVRKHWPSWLGKPPRKHDFRGTRPCGRSNVGHRRAGGRPHRQPGSHVALHGGNQKLEPDLAPSRHPHSARTLLRLAGRTGKRLPVPYLPGFDTLGTLKAILKTGYDYSWFILTQKIVEKEFALSGSEQNPDLTEKNLKEVIRQRVLPGPTDPVQAFLDHGEDFVIAGTLPELVEGMNRLTGEDLLDPEEIERQIRARDREIDNSFTKDLQIAAIRVARNYIGDRLTRVAKPHKLLDPKNGPLIAVRLHILTRKTLGGLQTDLSGRVLDAAGNPVPGLYAAGEVAGFGGGGVHGYRALEGTFLGGCLFTGRQAGRALAKALS